jgi:hypothetical protein
MNKIKIIFVFFLFVLFGCNSSILDDPATSIRYIVGETSYVKLVLINSYDTEIETLVDEEQLAGVHQVSFDNSNLAEGIYFYTLELRGESGTYSKITRHFLLLK